MNPRVESSPLDLDELHLRIARRADELARLSPSGGSPKRDLETWLRAEREAFALVDAESVRVLPDTSPSRWSDNLHSVVRVRGHSTRKNSERR